MKTMLPTEVRNRWKKVLREVSDDAEEIRIHLKGGRSVVLLPGDTYESLLATLELMSDPEAVRAIRRHRAGQAGKTYTRMDVERAIRNSA